MGCTRVDKCVIGPVLGYTCDLGLELDHLDHPGSRHVLTVASLGLVVLVVTLWRWIVKHRERAGQIRLHVGVSTLRVVVSALVVVVSSLIHSILHVVEVPRLLVLVLIIVS